MNEPFPPAVDPPLPPEVSAALATLRQWLKTQEIECVLLCTKANFPPAHIGLILRFTDTE